MATTTPELDVRVAKMTFALVYPHYTTRVELQQVIEWLTGF